MLYKTLALAAFASVAAAQDLATILQNATDLSNLTTYLGLFPDLQSQVASAQNVTILAPNNDAFAAFLNSSAAAAANDTAAIQAVLQYHVLQGAYANISETSFIPSSLEPGDYANVTGGQVVQAVVEDGNVTFFSGLLANASVVQTINYTGGVIHVIDSVLELPSNLSVTAIESNLTAAAGALTALNLVDTLQGLSDITIFVPDNEAFQAIGSALANASTELLTSVLQYHVVPSVFYSTDLSNTSVATLQGNNITITVSGENVFVNGARVTVPDLLISNGVIHVIDNVLNPENNTASNSTSEEGSPAFGNATSATDVPFTSGVPEPTRSAPVATSEAPGATSSGGAKPMKTGAVGAAALFGGAAIVLNL